jgi:hypothetical protein
MTVDDNSIPLTDVDPAVITIVRSTFLRRGGANQDGFLDISDPICILSFLFDATGTACAEAIPVCMDAADTNDDGQADISDGVHILSYLFLQGPSIPPPADTCGVDWTQDNLSCERFPACNDST